MNQSLITDSLSQVVTTVSNTADKQSISILDLSMKGGWIMIVLLILSILAVYFFISKFLEIQKASQEDKSFMDRIKDYMVDNKISSAIKLCDDSSSPYANMIKTGITHRDQAHSDIRIAIENVGNVEIGKLEKRLGAISTISAAAPMIGFLGTVTGMLQAFFDMANTGNAGVNIQVFSSGIYQALVTTVAGLIVGIVALFAYNYLTAKLDGVINKMESKTVEFMDIINNL